MRMPRLILFVAMLAGVTAVANGGSFYKGQAVFSTRPSDTKSLQTIARFGPVGMGIDLVQPAFGMKIHNIEEGSPAAATGKLKAGQIIESINGQKLKDIDPRIQLGRIIADAEAADGVLKFMIKDAPDAQAVEVVVEIPVLGAYSKTWPLNCPKSDKIVRNFADYVAKGGNGRGAIRNIGMLFLLSTGEDKDLEVVRKWARGVKCLSNHASWYLGYGGIPLCEYYLRTGDKSVLPAIQRSVDGAEDHYYLGGWSCRGYGNFRYMGGGHLNAGGTSCATFVVLAKECGVKVRDRVLLGAIEHFYRFAGRGNNPYGDHRPETGFVDNGKTGNLAFLMAAAASLTPDGENSLYAQARDVSAVKSFYTTSFMLHGHTGGGVGEIWRSAAMGLLYDKKPTKYREFMDNRQWHYDLSRRWDGSFAILGGGGYDDTKWGNGYALAYTMPRKTLRITGAPPSKFSKKYKLPERIWGTEADDAFLSLEAAKDKNGRAPVIDQETLAGDSAKQIIARLDAEDVNDQMLRSYLHHQDYGIRRQAACRLAGVKVTYLGGPVARKPVDTAVMIPMLKSADPRVRRAGVDAIAVAYRGSRSLPTRELPDDLAEALIKIVSDSKESWWVVDGALEVLGLARTEQIVPHVDVILSWLRHDDWWLQNSAIAALSSVAGDERCYRKIIPLLGEVIAHNQNYNTLQYLPQVMSNLRIAGPKVQKIAARTFGDTYTVYPDLKKGAKTEALVKQGLEANLELVARVLSQVPGGFDRLYDVAGRRFPGQILPHKEFYLSADPNRFGPKVKNAIKPIIMGELIPEFVGKNRVRLLPLAACTVQSSRPGGRGDSIDQLTALYRKAGVSDYDWHMFADIRQAEWSYHTFDPIPAEQVTWDQLITRYREVTMPTGMENWYAMDFDPAKAGWKKGRGAFGQYEGKIPQHPIGRCSDTCVGPGCYGATKVNTLWDKEVLLLRGTFTIPPMKPGYRYRLRVNDGDHVGAGGGHIIYINGKKLIEAKTCGGRGSGGLPKGAFITKEFMGDFQAGKVTIAVKTFLRFNAKYKLPPKERIPQGVISLHFEEMKLPPMGDDLVIKSAAVVSMLTSAWQAKQNPDDAELQTDNDMFRYDGKFVANPKLPGTWRTVAVVKTIEEFAPGKKTNTRGARFANMTFREEGGTDSVLWLWSGDTLMDLTRYQALKMVVKTIDGGEYLFVEIGGFSTRNKPGWQTTWQVMKQR